MSAIMTALDIRFENPLADRDEMFDKYMAALDIPNEYNVTTALELVEQNEELKYVWFSTIAISETVEEINKEDLVMLAVAVENNRQEIKSNY